MTRLELGSIRLQPKLPRYNSEKYGHAFSSKHHLGNYAAEPKRVEFPGCGVRTTPGSTLAACPNAKTQKRRVKLILERVDIHLSH